jgi:DNA ligase (NAD+)
MAIIDKILEQLRAADVAYYNDGTSTISDKEYDRLKDLLRNLDPDNAYLKEVAHEGGIVTEWEKVKHQYPLGSLNKCNEFAEFKSWFTSGAKILQEKLDGISLALTYEQGILHTAITRGDGEIGDNILPNVMKMKGVPKFIKNPPKSLVVRAEIVLKHSDWLKMPIDERGKNPRNTAAGAAKELNGSKCKYLTVIAYNILNSPTTTELEDLNLLREYGFNVVEFATVTTANQANIMYGNYIDELRKKLDYDIDGLVFKPNVKVTTDDWKYPKHQIAWKFPHQSAETILKDVIWQVSGDRVNPVAILDPVDVAGVTVSKASLHNVEFIKNLNIKIGDKVEITRRNDVIPHIERVLVSYGGETVKVPTNCPICSGDLHFDTNINEEEMAWMVCTNQKCPAKLIKDILKWLEVHDTKGIAEKTIETLYEQSVFKNLKEFIELSNLTPIQEKNILSIEGMGDTKIETLKDQITKTLNCELTLFFAGLNAPGFGRRMWERIIKYLQIEKDSVSAQDVLDFITIPYEKGLGHIEGFAETNSKELQKFVKDNSEYINELVILVKPQVYSKPSLTSEKLKGKSFCFTGEISMSRKEAQDNVIKNGGEVKSSVTKGLTYLVTNEPNSGSTKNKKAQQLGTQIISGEQFLELIK